MHECLIGPRRAQNPLGGFNLLLSMKRVHATTIERLRSTFPCMLLLLCLIRSSSLPKTTLPKHNDNKSNSLLIGPVPYNTPALRRRTLGSKVRLSSFLSNGISSTAMPSSNAQALELLQSQSFHSSFIHAPRSLRAYKLRDFTICTL